MNQSDHGGIISLLLVLILNFQTNVVNGEIAISFRKAARTYLEIPVSHRCVTFNTKIFIAYYIQIGVIPSFPH